MLKKRFAVAILAAFLMIAAFTAQAQTIRFYTTRGSHLYEVIEGARTGGGYVQQNRGTVLGIPVIGYTDRVSRGDLILTHITGSGVANYAGIKIRGSVAFRVPNYRLPSYDLRTVSTNVNDDDIVVFVIQGRSTVEKRVPIGTR